MSKKKFFFALVVSLCFLVLAFDVKVTSGSSMFPSIRDGEILLVFKLAYQFPLSIQEKTVFTWKSVRAGDVVLFKNSGRSVVKRVALESGAPLVVYKNGETTFLCLDNLYLKLSPESYLHLCANGRLHFVPDGYLVVLGDRLDVSHDSRSYGFVAEKNILGKVLFK